MGKELFELAEESLESFLLINKCKKCTHYDENIVCEYYQKVFGGNPISGEDRTEVFREYFIFDRQKVAFICKKTREAKVRLDFIYAGGLGLKLVSMLKMVIKKFKKLKGG